MEPRDYMYFDGRLFLNFEDANKKLSEFKYRVSVNTFIKNSTGTGWSCGRYNDYLHEHSIPYLSKRILENPKTYYFLESSHAIMFKLRFEGMENGKRV
jgi:hypothetical protein